MSLTDDNQITSVDNGQLPSFPDIVDQPEPPRSEPQRHTGVFNTYDPVLKLQNIFTAELTWSTNDQPGTIIWYAPLHPKYMSLPMQHLAAMYTYWSGDIIYTIKIAGTAFHAGALTVVELPPSESPLSFAGSKAYTVYNWTMIDAKNPSLEGFRVRDVRQGAFHYIDRKAESLSTIDIGGHIMLVVDMPLNTSSTGTQQISVQIWSKPAENFQFLKLKMPSRIKDHNETTAAILLETEMNFTAFDRGSIAAPSFHTPITKMVIQPSSIKISTVNLANHFSLDGKLISSEAVSLFAKWIVKVTKKEFQEDFDQTMISFTPQGPIPGAVSHGFPFYTVGKTKVPAPGYIEASNLPGHPEAGQISLGTYRGKADGINVEDRLECWSVPDMEAGCTPIEKFSMVAEESFITFSGLVSTGGGLAPACMQTGAMARTFQSGALANWIPANQAALFSVIDESESLPIMQAKLYKEGYMTTRAMKKETTFSLEDIQFKFIGFVPRTSKLERSAEHSRNRLLVQSKQRMSSR